MGQESICVERSIPQLKEEQGQNSGDGPLQLVLKCGGEEKNDKLSLLRIIDEDSPSRASCGLLSASGIFLK